MADDGGGFAEGSEGYGVVGWVEQTVDGGAAGVHPAGRFRFGEDFLTDTSIEAIRPAQRAGIAD